MAATDPGETLIKSFESCRLTPYDDKYPERVLRPGMMVFGTLTAGWGHTGSDVRIAEIWTQDRADSTFERDIASTKACLYDPNVIRVTLSTNQRGALEDLVFNIGVEAFERSTILVRLNAEDYDGAAEHFYDYVHSKGVYMPGLFRRRTAELKLWHSGMLPLLTAADDSTAALNAAELAGKAR